MIDLIKRIEACNSTESFHHNYYFFSSFLLYSTWSPIFPSIFVPFAFHACLGILQRFSPSFFTPNFISEIYFPLIFPWRQYPDHYAFLIRSELTLEEISFVLLNFLMLSLSRKKIKTLCLLLNDALQLNIKFWIY